MSGASNSLTDRQGFRAGGNHPNNFWLQITSDSGIFLQTSHLVAELPLPFISDFNFVDIPFSASSVLTE